MRPYIQNFSVGGYCSCSYCTIYGEYNEVKDSIVFPPDLTSIEHTDKNTYINGFSSGKRAEALHIDV